MAHVLTTALILFCGLFAGLAWSGWAMGEPGWTMWVVLAMIPYIMLTEDRPWLLAPVVGVVVLWPAIWGVWTLGHWILGLALG